MSAPLWHSPVTLDALNAHAGRGLAARLGIVFTAFGDDWLAATMPVDDRTRQPFGLLHGGASLALAETLGSVASVLAIDRERRRPVGLEINANHVRAVRDGAVHGVARPLHVGGTTHVWDVRIADGDERLVCVARLTVALLDL
jgi:1,4-dihydroxy-2-naphthoyl-CoA hydrolase